MMDYEILDSENSDKKYLTFTGHKVKDELIKIYRKNNCKQINFYRPNIDGAVDFVVNNKDVRCVQFWYEQEELDKLFKAKHLKLLNLLLNKCKVKLDLSYNNELDTLTVDAKYLDKSSRLPRSLRSLTIENVDSERLNDIASLDNLNNLHVIKSTADNITILNNLKKLKYLYIDRFKNITNFPNLSGLEKLEELVIDRPNANINIENISNMKSLKSLKLDGFKSVVDLNYLGNLTELENLLVINSKEIITLKPILKLHKIKYLSIGSTNVLDGDVKCVKDNIAKFYFSNKRHYNAKFEFIKGVNY